MNGKVGEEEARDVLLRAIAGSAAVRLLNPGQTWDQTYAGDVGFVIDGWEFWFFNDCDDLDYVDSVRSPDGRFAEYGDWKSDCGAFSDPLSGIDSDGCAALERLLKEAA